MGRRSVTLCVGFLALFTSLRWRWKSATTYPWSSADRTRDSILTDIFSNEMKEVMSTAFVEEVAGLNQERNFRRGLEVDLMSSGGIDFLLRYSTTGCRVAKLKTNKSRIVCMHFFRLMVYRFLQMPPRYLPQRLRRECRKIFIQRVDRAVALNQSHRTSNMAVWPHNHDAALFHI